MDNPGIWCAAAAIIAAIISIVAWLGDRARMRRDQLDRVGFVPWRAVSFWSTVLAILLIAGAIKLWQDG